jgi:hypothetical protein
MYSKAERMAFAIVTAIALVVVALDLLVWRAM